MNQRREPGAPAPQPPAEPLPAEALRALVELQGLAVSVLRGPELEFVYLNQASALLSGAPETLLGRRLADTHPHVQGLPWFAQLQETVRDGQPRRLRDVNVDGRVFDLRFARLDPSLVAVFFEDVSALVAHERQQAMLAELGSAALEGTPPAAMLLRILDALRASLSLDFTFAIEADASGRLHVAVHSGAAIDESLRKVPPETIPGEVFASGVPLAVGDLRARPDLHARAHVLPPDARAAAFVPFGEPQRRGVLVAGSRSVRTFPPHDEQFLARVGKLLGEARTRAQVEEATRLGEDFLNRVLDAVSPAVAVLDREGRFIRWNRASAETTNLPPEHAVGRRLIDGPWWSDERSRADAERALAGAANGRRTRVELRIAHPKGRMAVMDVSFTPMAEADGTVSRIVVSGSDVTDRDAALHALADSEERYALAVAGTSDGIWDADLVSGRHLCSPRYAELLGYPMEEIPRTFPSVAEQLFHPEDRARALQLLERHYQDGQPFDLELRMKRRDGRHRWFRLRGEAVRSAAGEPVRMLGSLSDIHERHLAEQALRQSQRELGDVLNALPVFVAVVGRDGRVDSINRTAWMGLEPEAPILGHALIDLRAFGSSTETRKRMQGGLERALAGKPARFDVECVVSASGASAWFDVSLVALAGPGGDVDRVLVSGIDITERKRAEAALRHSEELFRAIAEQSAEMLFILDALGRISYASPTSQSVLGRAPGEFVGKTLAALAHPDDVTSVLPVFEKVLESPGSMMSSELRLQSKDGEWRRLSARGHNLLELPAVSGVLVTLRDITEERAAEEMLQRSQKMEALGQLAGGVAHDFNNLLTAIKGYNGVALSQLPPDDPIREDLLEVEKAADRAAALTHRLLAMGRRQVFQPKLLELGDLLRDMKSMLQRALGEDVRLEVEVQPGPLPVFVDYGQLEQVVLNLAVNARDAMPAGGTLTLHADRVPSPGGAPGRFVRLRVRDTGAGMTPEVVSHLFEPFYTTKERGKGTGLGLATVYGIVQQAGGIIEVDTGVGKGTEFRIQLPEATDARASPPGTPRVGGARPRGSETLLLVEDEDSVRAVTRRALAQLGYTVLEAVNGEEALSLRVKDPRPIDLVITDVVMPVMGGRELVEKLRERGDGRRVLFLSGYTDDAILRRGGFPEGTAFLAKPFTLDTIAQKVRDVLDDRA